MARPDPSAMLAAMGRWEEFELHFNGALTKFADLETHHGADTF